MSESPWAKSPSSRAAAPARISKPANWGFYLIIYFGLLVLGSLVVSGLKSAGVNLPGLGVLIAILFTSVMVSGSRYLKANGQMWTRSDRARLALAYTAVDLGLFVIFGGLTFLALQSDPSLAAEMELPSSVSEASSSQLTTAVAIALVITLALYYGLTRLVLGVFVNSQARATDENGKLL